MAYAFVETGSWGWGSVMFLSTFAASVGLIVAFVARCAHVDNPLFDLKLFASPTFRLANAATLLFSVGFAAMFLGNVLFLTRVWGYSIIRAGLVVSMGPIVVAITAPLFGRLAGRIGQRALLVPGGIIWATGALLLLVSATTTPHYLTQYLPAVLLTALGVSLILPQLSSVAVQGLPADSYASGSAVNQAVRNLGATLGVALVLGFTSAAGQATSLEGFHHVWILMLGAGGGVTALSWLLPRPRPAVSLALS